MLIQTVTTISRISNVKLDKNACNNLPPMLNRYAITLLLMKLIQDLPGAHEPKTTQCLFMNENHVVVQVW